MGAMVPPPHWIPEDDLLLKNSIESGASLESLAKGAVQFSRRFTIQEIQDRWYSLLYDPDVAGEASTLMTELELSSFHQARPNKPESAKETSMKRKAESIRKSYYAMRKRICNDPFDMMNINILSGGGNSNELPDGVIGDLVPNNLEIQGPEIKIEHPFSEDEVSGFGGSNQLPLCNLFEEEPLESGVNACPDFAGPSFGSFACPSTLPEMPIWTQDEHARDTFVLPEDGDANGKGPLGYGGSPSNPELKTSMPCDGMSNLPPSTEDYFAELSNTLFDFSNDDELLFEDTNGKGILEKSYLDGLSSLLLDSPNQSEFPIAGPGEDSVVVAADVETIGDVALHRCDQRKVPEAPLEPSVSNINRFGPEYKNGVICCTLNTEDPEIPSNDDVFLEFFPSPTNDYGAHCTSYDPSYFLPSSSKAQKGNGKPPSMKNNHKDASTPSHAIGSSQPFVSGLKYPTGNHGVKFELPKSNIQNAALRNSRTDECPNRIGGSSNFSGGVVMGGANGKLTTGQDIPQSFPKGANGNLTTERELITEPVDNPVGSDQEELWSENEFDVPYFSDVEAMILDMDLSPDEFDLYANPEVQCYQHEETKRTIIRLEQATNSCMQRAIAAQGALAVLYGRVSKHFIKKSEVLLGRSTEEVEVDIDLGSERNGGKISRRQAIIKMNMDGTFHLRNIGKSSVYVNDSEVATGQSLTLTSGCLIEVRGLAYVFETNHALVQQHVHSINNGGLFLDHKPSIQR